MRTIFTVEKTAWMLKVRVETVRRREGTRRGRKIGHILASEVKQIGVTSQPKGARPRP